MKRKRGGEGRGEERYLIVLMIIASFLMIAFLMCKRSKNFISIFFFLFIVLENNFNSESS